MELDTHFVRKRAPLETSIIHQKTLDGWLNVEGFCENAYIWAAMKPGTFTTFFHSLGMKEPYMSIELGRGRD